MIGSTNMHRSNRQLHTQAGTTGFTLVEALIATALLSIVIVMVVGMSLQFFGTQRVARDELYLEGTARQTFALIAERSRESIVDYTFYDDGTPSSDPDQFLALRNEERDQTAFWFYDTGTEVALFMCDDKQADEECDHTADPTAGGDWAQVTPDDIELTVARFPFSPTSPPYYDDTTPPASDQSPIVTIVMQLQLLDSDTATDVLQTSLTPRLYVR